MSGETFDRHLLGLQLSVLSGEELPSLFTDPTYSKVFHFCLSTSQVIVDIMYTPDYIIMHVDSK